MVKLEYLLEIDKQWLKIKKWWESIKLSDNLFPNNFKKINNEEKNNYKKNFIYFIKKIFDIDDLTNIDKIDKININNYDIDKLLDNFKLNFNSFKILIDDDIEFKNIIYYILNFKKYFSLIKKKFLEIVEPLLNDVYFDKLFRCDNDLTRLLGPIFAPITYIYLINRNIEETINIFLNLDNIFIQFFIINYLILDNFMDDNNYYEENKIIFLKWFMNIIYTPENEIIINEEQNKIWQCIIFKKYFTYFIEKYPVKNNKILYKFVKLMIHTIKEIDTIQKNNNITEDTILECTFKKSYVAIFFLIIIVNKQVKYKLSKKNIYLLSKFVFIIQLYDDFGDINNDILEKNNTYFTIRSNIDDRIKKIILSTFLLKKNINEKNDNINNIIVYFIKNIFLYNTYINNYKISKELINYISNFSYIDTDVFQYFDTDSYNQYNSNIILNIFKKYITNK